MADSAPAASGDDEPVGVSLAWLVALSIALWVLGSLSVVNSISDDRAEEPTLVAERALPRFHQISEGDLRGDSADAMQGRLVLSPLTKDSAVEAGSLSARVCPLAGRTIASLDLPLPAADLVDPAVTVRLTIGDQQLDDVEVVEVQSGPGGSAGTRPAIVLLTDRHIGTLTEEARRVRLLEILPASTC